jgi:hypothetical protein
LKGNGKELVMERRFAVRYEELMAEAEVKPEALEGVRKWLEEFIQPVAGSLKYEAQTAFLTRRHPSPGRQNSPLPAEK